MVQVLTKIDATAAIAKLEALKQRLRARVRQVVEDGASELQARVQTKLSGEVLQARSGALGDSIKTEVVEDADSIGARVSSDVPYARIHEYGGRINVPKIAARNAKVLAFEYGGRMVFAKRTAAHVVTMPERSFMRSALAEFAPLLLDDIRKVTAEALP